MSRAMFSTAGCANVEQNGLPFKIDRAERTRMERTGVSGTGILPVEFDR